jgi:hypothetical protein
VDAASAAAGRGRGRGGRAAHSLSPKETECPHDKYFEFVVFINNDPFCMKKLPDKFPEFLAGREPAEVTLREASCGFFRWTMVVFFDGKARCTSIPAEEVCPRLQRRVRLLGELLLRRRRQDGVKVFDIVLPYPLPHRLGRRQRR